METKEKQENTNETVKNSIAQITYSMENIADLVQEELNPRLTKCIETNMQDILEVLPPEVNVFALSKDLVVSRAKKNTKILNIWRESDLKKYVKELESGINSKKTVYGSLSRWR